MGRPQEAVRMTSIKIPCGPDIFPLLLFLPFLMSLSSSALIRSPLRGDHRSSVHSRPIRMMLDPEDKDDLDNREYEDFPQVTRLLFDQVLHPINPGADLPSSLLPDSRLQ